MKKRITSILALLVACMTLLTACTGNPTQNPSGDSTGDLKGTYEITVWVSEIDGMKELTEKQIKAFEAANPGIVIKATVEGISEANSATQMLTSVEDGADLYCFAQDQLARLVIAGALNKLGDGAAATVKENNDAISVGAASVGGVLYCYPLTSDNGYYMYYDKSVIKESSLDSLEDIIADCEAAGRNFSYELANNAWYNAGFFFATGCVSEWTTDAEGNFTSVNDTFSSDAGLIALKGMQKVLKSKAHVESSNVADFSAAIPSAVVISGPWASKDAQAALGDNYAATDLPSFEVDGKSYHIGSFSGNKLMGVKPSTDVKKTAVLNQLALYLTNGDCQLERFNQFGWGPSNVTAQANDAVKNDPALVALAKQSEFAKPQPQIHGSWWDICKLPAVAAKDATTDDELKAALAKYKTDIDALFEMTEDQKQAWSVIGTVNGTNWDTDFAMEKESDNVYVSKDVFAMTAGMEFKVRQGAAWTVNYGGDGKVDGANYIVEADGNYKVKLTINADGTAVLELVAQ